MFNICLFLSLLQSLCFAGSIFFPTTKEEKIESKTIYFDFSLNEQFRSLGINSIFHYNNGQDINIEMINVGNDIFSVSKPIPIEVFENPDYGFELFLSGHDEPEYKTIWMSGGNNLSKQNYNYISILGNNDKQNASLGGFGFFGTKYEQKGSTYQTQRIWLSNNNELFYSSDNWNSPCQNAIGFFFNGQWQMTEMVRFENTHSLFNLYYADIPYEVISISFLRLSSCADHNFTIYQESPIDSLTYGICYEVGTTSLDDSFSVVNKTINGATANLLSYVLEAYLTFGAAKSNCSVQSTVYNIFNTWIAQKQATEEEMINTKILDYSNYAKNGNSYIGLSKDSYYSLKEKWNGMCKNAKLNPSNGEKMDGLFSWFDKDDIIIFSSIILINFTLAIVIIVYTRYRKKEQNKSSDRGQTND